MAGAAAGPWPALAPATLFLRVPLAAAGIVLALRWLGRGWRAAMLAAACAAALGIDAFVPRAEPIGAVAARASRGATELSLALGQASHDSGLHTLLYGTSGEAQPEEAFTLAATVAERLPYPVASLALCDERGDPVAWHGPAPRLPIRLRPVGERTVAAEPGVGSVWLWWREPVYEGGRPVGSVLAGMEVPERGLRRLLGAWAGRRVKLVPLLAGGGAVEVAGTRIIGLAEEPAPPPWWGAGGWCLAVAAGALSLVVPLAWRLPALVLAGGALVVAGWLPPAWWQALLLFAVAAGLAKVPRRWRWALPTAAAVAVLAWLQPAVLSELLFQPVPDNLLTPSLALVAVTLAWTTVLRAVPVPGGPTRVVPALAAWSVLVFGAASAQPPVMGVSLGLVALLGLPRRSTALAAVAAAALLVASSDADHRRALVATTESTLARIEHVEAPARAFLASLPQTALEGVAHLDSREQVVVLGRIASWSGFGVEVPGATLAMTGPDGASGGIWGEVPLPGGQPPRELASRVLPNGWRIAVLAPPPPHEVLQALARGGFLSPSAVFDRAGAAVAHGAVFRPLPPDVVGKALAAGRSWADVGVGEREFATYLRARGDSVVAVPWIRAPIPEWLLIVAALALWSSAPLVVWRERRRIVSWWRERATFAGRVRTITVAATVLPVTLLGQFLPQQWARQREQVRLELARSVSQILASPEWQREAEWIVRGAGGTVAVYENGALAFTSRPDLAALGRVPGLPPPAAYTRAVRGWQEPLVEGGAYTSVFAPLRWGDTPVVGAVLWLPTGPSGLGPGPREWFVITALWAMALGVALAEMVGARIVRPLRGLLAAAGRLQRGEDVGPLTARGDEEVATLVDAFGSMAQTVKERELELRHEKDLLASVLGTLSAAVVVAGPGGEVRLANPAAAALLGGQSSLAPVAATFGYASEPLIARVSAGERVSEVVHPANHPEQSWRLTALPLAYGEGSVLVVLEDLSDLARAERLASLAELARIVAHEVKNPLTPIRLWAEELKAADDTRLPEIARVAAEQILERADHLREVAQGFSNLVALEHWEAEPVELGKLAREVAEEYTVLGERGIQVRVEVGTEVAVLADPRWLARALRHLLDNSVKALGSRQGMIVVGAGIEGDGAALWVRDTAGGVPEGNLGKIFEPHFSTTSHGTGLGLAVVQRVATWAGGTARARNLSDGLEVRLVFPPPVE